MVSLELNGKLPHREAAQEQYLKALNYSAVPFMCLSKPT